MPTHILRTAAVAGTAALVLAATAQVGAASAKSTTDLISRNSGGKLGNCQSLDPATSGNGRLIVFTSCANNLVPNDTGPWGDVFLRDRATGKTTLISKTKRGAFGNQGSSLPAISGNGRFVVFTSGASNLVKHDTNGHADVFRLDRKTGTMIRVSVGKAGRQGNADSGGRGSAVSDDGRFVAFNTRATNLSGADDTNGFDDLYLRDLKKGTTTLISKDMAGDAASVSEPPEISGNGRYVVYGSFSPTLVPGDTNGPDAFLYDRVSKATVIVSAGVANPLGQHQGENPSISTNGKIVAFRGISQVIAGAAQIYKLRLSFGGDGAPQQPEAADYTLVSVASGGGEGNFASGQPAVNKTGSVIAFSSDATNLVTGDTNGKLDVFRFSGGSVKRVSLSNSGRQANDASPAFGGLVDINATGRTIVFSSMATNLVKKDNNSAVDVFARIQ